MVTISIDRDDNFFVCKGEDEIPIDDFLPTATELEIMYIRQDLNAHLIRHTQDKEKFDKEKLKKTDTEKSATDLSDTKDKYIKKLIKYLKKI